MVDATRSAEIRVSAGQQPTLISWDHEARPVRYDVIRGDVASLGFGGGGAVDLGAVVCVEDDSPDADTSGFEDGGTPAPGQAFFYAYRGTQGTEASPGSYGSGSGGGERVAAGEDCGP